MKNREKELEQELLLMIIGIILITHKSHKVILIQIMKNMLSIEKK